MAPAQPLRLARLIVILFCSLTLLLPTAAWAGLPPGNAVTDPAALLRDALPFDQPDLRELQHLLEHTDTDLRASRWSVIRRNCQRAVSQLPRLDARVGGDLEAKGVSDRDQLDQLAADLRAVCAASQGQGDRDAFLAVREAALADIGAIEAQLVDGFPFEIPAEFDALPRLLGRATVELETSKGRITTIVDGYNAPLTAGAYVDLVQRGFYDGLPFDRAEQFYVLQTGNPGGAADGFVDPDSGEERNVPLEIRIPGERDPFYNLTFEELGLYKAVPTLPFSSYGTLGWAHSDRALDDGSSQFFMFLFQPQLTPAGLNLIDGRYAAFGYVVDGFTVLQELGADDRIIEARVIEGGDGLRAHA